MSIDEERQRYLMKTLSQAVHEFFDGYGLDCTVTERHIDEVPRAELGSVVGFEGAALAGGLALVAPDSLVEQMLPVPRATERSVFQLRDWGGEMANQLLGRLKNKLSGAGGRGNDFAIGTPTCMRGVSMRFSLLPDAYGASLRFSIASAKAGVRVYLDCTVCEVPVPLSGVGGPASGTVSEGELVLF